MERFLWIYLMCPSDEEQNEQNLEFDWSTDLSIASELTGGFCYC